jgi:branched-chain amino acid transport system substrate-binding protein
VLDSKALTKVQSVALIAVIAVAAVSGAAAYFLLGRPASSSEDIKIGICADLDNTIGKGVYQAALLASEQINAQGGVLGRNFTIIAEDDDDEATTVDLAVASNAMNKLITIDKADFVICNAIGPTVLTLQDICADQKKIYLGTRGPLDNITQRVVDNFDRYKYYFKLTPPNATTVAEGTVDDTVALANLTGFTKIAYLGVDGTTGKQIAAMLASSLPKHGLSLVYSGLFPVSTTDFTSYLAAVDASGAEILVPLISNQASVPFAKEYYERESPFVVSGSLSIAGDSNFWTLTEGKCEYISFAGLPALSGFPLTNKTVATREAYFQRWGTKIPSGSAVGAYDGLRFILPDAIKRAGTTETEAVVKALETTDVETSTARHFVFTTSHDIFIGAAGPNKPEEDYFLTAHFQYHANGTLSLVYPLQLMEETGGTFIFPPWKGPWGDRQTP